MFTRTETYTDFNGLERTETAYFNLTKSELIQLELGTTGGFAESAQKMINENDLPRIIEMIKTLLLRSYGKKSEDGSKFVKSKELSEAFEQSTMFDIIFMDLVTNADKASEFINGVVPSDLAATLANNASLPIPNNS